MSAYEVCIEVQGIPLVVHGYVYGADRQATRFSPEDRAEAQIEKIVFDGDPDDAPDEEELAGIRPFIEAAFLEAVGETDEAHAGLSLGSEHCRWPA